MSSVPSSSYSGTSKKDVVQIEAVVRLLGPDPWMRFDMWATRAWEVTQQAIDLALSNGVPMSSDNFLDPRVAAVFHAADVAKEFAEMVNPLIVVANLDSEGGGMTDDEILASIALNSGPEELD